MRAAAIASLAIVTVAAGLFAYGALSNLWADYQDSTPTTYIEIGVLWLAVAIWAAATAVVIGRRR